MDLLGMEEAHFVTRYEGLVLDLARLLGLVQSGGRIATLAATYYCRQVFAAMPREDRQDERKVRMFIHDELTKTVDTACAIIAATAIHRGDDRALDVQMSWDRMKRWALETLGGMELIQRLAMALAMLGWRPAATAALLDDVLADVSAKDLEPSDPDRIAQALDDFRDRLCAQLRDLDTEHEWLCEVISREASFRREYDTIKRLRYLRSLPKDTRYALPHKLDRYPAIELWTSRASRPLQRCLPIDDLLHPPTPLYDDEERYEDGYDFDGDSKAS